MNLHAPQSYEASTELDQIAAVRHQIIGPREGKPSIGIVQDTLVGVYRLTKNDNKFTRREYMNLMMYNKGFEGLPKATAEVGVAGVAGSRWSGHQVVSSLLPPVNMDMGNKSFDDDPRPQNKVKIVEGQVINGTLDKDVFSKTGKGIIHMSYNDYGPETTVDMIDSMQTTIESFLVYNGFSVGISDMIADDKTRQQMEEVIQARKKEVNELNLQVHLDLFDNNTGKPNQEEFEARVFAALNKATKEAGDFGQLALADENRLVAMVKAGSKGGPINIAQMIACVGQQNIEGRRIPYGFSDRTLPHYKKYDDGPEARGFIGHSFIGGLTPQEFFFHAMSGREGLIDTAVKTADTGYIQRQLVKAMEDLTVQHDGTVRDANMNIVQYHYGEDGLNATKIEGTSISYVKLSEADIVRDFGLQKVDFTTVLEDGVQTEDYKTTPQVKEYVKQILEDRKMIVEGMFASGRQGSVFGPMNLERVITNVKVRFGLKNTADTKTDLTPLYVLQGIEKLITRTQAYHRLWCALIRFHFAPHKIIVKERFTKAAFDALLELCVVKDWKAWSLPGELVGIIAAQSIGEPCTQLTLNSVDWDTEILIAKNGHIITPMIGEFIDNYYKDLIAKNKDDPRIQYLPNDQVYIELNDGNDWQAISPDENGTIQWTKLEAITFHPVINADGTNTILEVELESGRIVKATKARSFLTRGSNDELVDTNGSDLKIGNEIPIANTLALEQLGLITEINLREITEINPVTNKDEPVFPATKFMYGTDVSTAIACMKEADEQNTKYWFAKNQGKVFTVPYKRSDTFRDAMAGRNSNEFKIGHIYPKRTRPDVSHIPETISLTEEFGFFVGAYVAEGSSNTTQVCVTNNDLEYLAKVRGLMDKWNIGTHTTSEDREAAVSGIKGHTTTLVIHSTILSKMMGALFGKVSYKKTLPDWVLQAPDEFIHGFMDAYISGDGTVCLRSGVISASSVSKQLIDRLMAVLARYGIFTTTSSYTPDLQNFKSVARQYTIDIPAKYSKVFANTFTLTLANKQERLTKHFIENTKKRNCKRESVNDVIWDKVKKITCIPPLHDKVYDVTVAGTKNFMTINNICVKDTFHLAGYSAKSNVTRGVPRIKELLKVTENPKAIALTVYLKPEFRGNKDKVREVTQDLELTLLRDITVKTGIFFDPADNTTVVSEDKELIDFYHLFETREEGAVAEEEEATEAETEGGDSKKWSSWLLRLELDREKMFNKNINMDDISYALNHAFGKNFNASAVNLIYSDFNSKKLIMRIRLGKEDKTLGFGDDLAGLKKFQNKILNSIVIRGVPGIRSATFRKHADLLEHVGGEYKPIEQYVIDTDGTNFLEVMNHPAVDGTRLYSTHVHDIYQNLGVEAARACLISELFGLFEEAGVNYRHLGILCDVMTRNGRLMSIDRYGINKMDNGPLAKASFEETGSILLKAALFGEVDPITGVSANIMMGQSIRGGTAFSHILLDETAQERLLQGLPPVEETDESNEEEEGVDLTQEMIDAELYEDPNDACATTQLRMNISMPTDVPLLDEPEGELIVLEAS